jgi:hypothetical protein
MLDLIRIGQLRYKAVDLKGRFLQVGGFAFDSIICGHHTFTSRFFSYQYFSIALFENIDWSVAL